MYVLAHNWKDKIAVLLLKQSFTHIYDELSNNSIDSRLWSKIEGYTKQFSKIEKWDKCKILSYGLVDYLKKCDFSVEELHQFSAKAKINERLIHIWEKNRKGDASSGLNTDDAKSEEPENSQPEEPNGSSEGKDSDL